jgi:hypothetical protein
MSICADGVIFLTEDPVRQRVLPLAITFGASVPIDSY